MDNTGVKVSHENYYQWRKYALRTESVVLGIMGIIEFGDTESINYCGSLRTRKVVLDARVPPQTKLRALAGVVHPKGALLERKDGRALDCRKFHAVLFPLSKTFMAVNKNHMELISQGYVLCLRTQ